MMRCTPHLDRAVGQTGLTLCVDFEHWHKCQGFILWLCSCRSRSGASHGFRWKYEVRALIWCVSFITG